jgi:aerobic carbon-monoxide dehydrogenase medium subunit
VKPGRFAYWGPDRLDDALAFLQEHGEDSRVLAGGQSLVPLLNMRLVRPDYVIDLGGVPGLDAVREDDGGLRIGALCRQQALTRDAAVAQDIPLLARALPHIGHVAIRYRGTIGGSLAHADPAAELPAVAVALDARITLRSSSGARTLGAEDFFLTHLTTAIEPNEMLTDVWLPRRGQESTGAAVMELTRRHGDFALVGVAVQLTLPGKAIGSARVCAFGVDQVPRRLTEVEELLAGEEPGDDLLRQAGEAAGAAVDPSSDMHASAKYRRQMCGVLTTRAIAAAVADAGGGRR